MVRIEEPAPRFDDQGAGQETIQTHCILLPPICKLHNRAIVDRFPDGCPLTSENVADIHLEMMDQAWANLHPDGGNPSVGLAGLNRLDICMECQDKLRTDPVVRDLRDRKRRQNQRQTSAVNRESNATRKPNADPYKRSTYV